MEKILIYSTKSCPNCKMLKQLLEKENIRYKEIDMATPVGLTELRMNGCYALSAPVLQVDNKFYTTKEICKSDMIDQNIVTHLITLRTDNINTKS